MSNLPPLVMGVVNVTPDSFALRSTTFEDACRQAETLVREGADILDFGGESSRPGADEVSEIEEYDRVIPVVQWASKNLSIKISIDTRRASIATAAIESGATIVNDISAGEDPKMFDVIRKSEVTYLLMHRLSSSKTMQIDPSYPRGVVTEIREFLSTKVTNLKALGISKNRLWVDPGIGFGKTLEHNLEILKNLRTFSEIGDRLVLGASLKYFIYKIMGDEKVTPDKRLPGTIAANLWGLLNGASVFRVHNVGECKQAITVWKGIQEAPDAR